MIHALVVTMYINIPIVSNKPIIPLLDHVKPFEAVFKLQFQIRTIKPPSNPTMWRKNPGKFFSKTLKTLKIYTSSQGGV